MERQEKHNPGSKCWTGASRLWGGRDGGKKRRGWDSNPHTLARAGFQVCSFRKPSATLGWGTSLGIESAAPEGAADSLSLVNPQGISAQASRAWRVLRR
jgi:hypothetical protein